MTAPHADLTLPADVLPGPEEITEHTINGFTILIENTNPRPAEPEPAAEPDTADEPVADDPATIWRVGVARAPGASVTHAVRVRTNGARLVPNTWTLCSEQGRSKRARGERFGAALSSVDCSYCRARLERMREL